MLVLDLDDTLLRDDYSISKKNIASLLKAQELGVKVVLASGRPTPAMLQFIAPLALEKFDSYLISFNGAVVTSIQNNEVLLEKSLTKEEVRSLHQFSKLNRLHIITYSEAGIITDTTSPYIDIEAKLTGLPLNCVDDFNSAIGECPVKCILLEEPEYLKQMEIKLKAEKPDLSVARSKPFFLEVMPNGIDKAASLDFLAKRLGIAQEEIIAVGNAGNDLSMIEYAGLGIWVDNVPDELREKAQVIVASNMDDGVAEVIGRFILT